jgi:hypothetical protein
VLAKNPRAVFQEQGVKRRRDDRIGGDECLTSGIWHRTLFFRQRVQQIREGGLVDIQRAHSLADEIMYTARVL